VIYFGAPAARVTAVNPIAVVMAVWSVVVVSLAIVQRRRLRRSGPRPWHTAPPLTGGGYVFTPESSAAIHGGATQSSVTAS